MRKASETLLGSKVSRVKGGEKTVGIKRKTNHQHCGWEIKLYDVNMMIGNNNDQHQYGDWDDN